MQDRDRKLELCGVGISPMFVMTWQRLVIAYLGSASPCDRLDVAIWGSDRYWWISLE
jgi:hypothetical protein